MIMDTLVLMGQIVIIPLRPTGEGILSGRPTLHLVARGAVIASPVVDDERLYLRSTKHICAYALPQGEEVWCQPAVRQGRVFMGFSLAPEVHTNVLLVPQDYTTLVAYKADSGETLWRQAAPDELDYEWRGIQDVAMQGDLVLVVWNGWKAAAFDLSSGDEIWSLPVEKNSQSFVAANSANAFLAVGPTLYALDLYTGKVLWQQDSNYIEAVAATEDQIYVGINESVEGLDTASLTEKWWVKPGKVYEHTGQINALLPLNGTVLAAADRLALLNAQSGEVVWSSAEMGPLEQPVQWNEVVLARTVEGDLLTFRLADGHEIGTLRLQKNLNGGAEERFRSPVVWNNLLIVPFGGQSVYVYQLDDE